LLNKFIKESNKFIMFS